jgi:hypothetical protein
MSEHDGIRLTADLKPPKITGTASINKADGTPKTEAPAPVVCAFDISNPDDLPEGGMPAVTIVEITDHTGAKHYFVRVPNFMLGDTK